MSEKLIQLVADAMVDSGLKDAGFQYVNVDDTWSTGRPIVFSLCAWSFYEWGIGMGQLWRTTSDITPTWNSSRATN